MAITPRSGTGTGVTYTGSNTAAATTSGNPFTIPSAAVPGDLLVLALELGTNAAQTIGGLTGWTLVLGPANATGATNPAYGVAYYRIMQAGDAAPTVTWTTSTRWRGLIQAFSGVDQSAPIDGSMPAMGVQSTSGTTSAAAASVTPTATNDLLVFVTMFRNTTTATPTATPPTGMTETAENPAITAPSGVNASMEMAHLQLSSAAATGTHTAALSLSSQSVAGHILLKTASASSVSVTGTGRSSASASGTRSIGRSVTGTGRSAAAAAGSRSAAIAVTGTGRSSASAIGTRGISRSVTGTGRSIAAAAGSRSAAISVTGIGRSAATAAGSRSAAIGVTGTGRSVATAAGARAIGRAVSGTGRSLASAAGTRTLSISATGTGRSQAAASAIRSLAIARSGTGRSVLSATGSGVIGVFRSGTGRSSASATGSSSTAISRTGTGRSVLGAVGHYSTTGGAAVSPSVLTIAAPSMYQRSVDSVSGPLVFSVGRYRFSSTYTSGGEAIGLGPRRPVVFVMASPLSGYSFSYNAGRLVAYTAGSEVSAGTDLSAIGDVDLVLVTR